jgi:hypothetical protein
MGLRHINVYLRPAVNVTARPLVLALLLVVLSSAACDETTVPLIERRPFPPAADANDGSDNRFDGYDGSSDAFHDKFMDAFDDPVDAPTVVLNEAMASIGSGPFSNPVLVETTSGPLSDPAAQNQDPTLTGDELELYFMSDRATANQDIWTTRRTATNLLWGPPTRVAEISSTAADNNPAVSLDGLTIWLSSNRDDTGNGFDIWVSTRQTRQDPWNPPTRVVELSSPSDDTAPAVDEAELVMVLVSNRPGGPGGRDIYISGRQSRSDPWGTPVPFAGVVNSPGDEVDPFLGAHGLQMFWAANMGAAEEIRWSARGSVVESFSSFAVLGELGSPSFDPALSVDLRHIMFASGRSGSNEIYEAFR